MGTAGIAALVLLAGSMAIAHATGFDGPPGCGASGSPSVSAGPSDLPSDLPSGSPSESPSPEPCPSGSASDSSAPPSESPSSSPSPSTSPSDGPPDPFHGVLDGTLTTTAGGPLASADVLAEDSVNPGRLSYGATTDASGHYRMRNMQPGKYRVSFRVPGTDLVQYLHRKRNINDANLVTITGGQVTAGNDRELATGTLAGRLLDRTGHPVHALVSAVDLTTGVNVFTETDSTGAFAVTAFTGSYRVDFRYGNGVDQYATGQLDASKAKQFAVKNGKTTVVNETTVPSGSVTGRILNSDGTPASNATVELDNLTVDMQLTTRTHGDGTYRMDLVPAGQYTAQVISSDFSRAQWVPHTVQQRAATLLTVSVDKTATVDDTFLPTGALSVTAKDAGGTQVNSFCVSVLDAARGFGGCTQNGILTMPGMPTGTYDVSVSTSQDTLLDTTVQSVGVPTGATTSITATLPTAGVILTSTVDAKTHQPVVGMCVIAVALDSSLTNRRGCSDGSGAVRIGKLSPGSYTLLTWPTDGVHGMQWVGPNGGTGSQYSARTVAAVAGQSTSVPAIQLDGAGALTGTVTDASTGKGIPYSCVAVVPVATDLAETGTCLGAVADASGHYTLSGVGPYAWPVQFAPVGNPAYAWQWYGGAASRKKAATVKVTVGKTVTVNAKLSPGTRVSGTVVGTNGAPLGARLLFRNADTGDVAAIVDQDGTYTVGLLPQTVRVSFIDGRQPARQVVYPNPVVVGSKAVTLNLTGL